MDCFWLNASVGPLRLKHLLTATSVWLCLLVILTLVSVDFTRKG